MFLPHPRTACHNEPALSLFCTNRYFKRRKNRLLNTNICTLDSMLVTRLSQGLASFRAVVGSSLRVASNKAGSNKSGAGSPHDAEFAVDEMAEGGKGAVGRACRVLQSPGGNGSSNASQLHFSKPLCRWRGQR